MQCAGCVKCVRQSTDASVSVRELYLECQPPLARDMYDPVDCAEFIISSCYNCTTICCVWCWTTLSLPLSSFPPRIHFLQLHQQQCMWHCDIYLLWFGLVISTHLLQLKSRRSGKCLRISLSNPLRSLHSFLCPLTLPHLSLLFVATLKCVWSTGIHLSHTCPREYWKGLLKTQNTDCVFMSTWQFCWFRSCFTFATNGNSDSN